jgi:hypothetical protein
MWDCSIWVAQSALITSTSHFLVTKTRNTVLRKRGYATCRRIIELFLGTYLICSRDGLFCIVGHFLYVMVGMLVTNCPSKILLGKKIVHALTSRRRLGYSGLWPFVSLAEWFTKIRRIVIHFIYYRWYIQNKYDMIYAMLWYDIWYGMIYDIWYGMIYDICYDMIYDGIWNDIYDMVWYDIWCYIWYII